jgi:hypothetical protein
MPACTALEHRSRGWSNVGHDLASRPVSTLPSAPAEVLRFRELIAGRVHERSYAGSVERPGAYSAGQPAHFWLRLPSPKLLSEKTVTGAPSLGADCASNL